MPFFLDGNPTPGEISEAVNYVLANLNDTVVANQGTGQIIGPTGEVTGYLYKYISIKYADSFDGTVNFSNTPTNRFYYGIRNSDSSVESTNPADYVWNAVTGGFSTTKFLYYITTGGRTIQFAVATAVPNIGWFIDPGVAIDLDFTSASSSVANFVVIRVPNSSAAPTDAECIAAIGRTPISGDLCTVNYNSGIFSITYKYTTGWAIFQKYITGDLIVANSIVANNMAANSITASNAAIADLTVQFLKIGNEAVSTTRYNVFDYFPPQMPSTLTTLTTYTASVAQDGDYIVILSISRAQVISGFSFNSSYLIQEFELLIDGVRSVYSLADGGAAIGNIAIGLNFGTRVQNLTAGSHTFEFKYRYSAVNATITGSGITQLRVYLFGAYR